MSRVLVFTVICAACEAPCPESLVSAATVEPVVLTLDGCADVTEVVTLRSTGTADVRVDELLLDGSWSLEAPTLPLTLAPGEELSLSVAGRGAGSLTFRTSAGDHISWFDGSGASAPALTWILPSQEATLDLDQATELVVATANTEDVSWSSDVDGVLGTSPVIGNEARFVWDPLQYSDGDHTLTATASSACGSASVERSVCQDRGYSEESLDLSVWEISGNAFWDEANEWLTLTTGGQFQSGTAFQTQQTVEADNIDITFLMYAGNRDGGADGMSLTVIDVDRMSTFVGGTGNGLGYAGLPGWTVEFDTYCNAGIDETCDDHVSFHLDGDHTIPQFTTVVPNLENDQWQPVRVVMDGSQLTVTLDGVEILSETVEGLTSFTGYVGFTAATGSYTNSHLVDALTVTQYVCESVD